MPDNERRISYMLWRAQQKKWELIGTFWNMDDLIAYAERYIQESGDSDNLRRDIFVNILDIDTRDRSARRRYQTVKLETEARRRMKRMF